ncbi:MAG: hypothetical protein GC159_07140 [Phycisphaera sp.]|nr:hypothetical protein [Phycisphaera sp.]
MRDTLVSRDAGTPGRAGRVGQVMTAMKRKNHRITMRVCVLGAALCLSAHAAAWAQADAAVSAPGAPGADGAGKAAMTADEAQALFKQTFGAELQRISGTPSKADDVAFAQQMLSVAQGQTQVAAVSTVMLEQAYKLASTSPEGFATAVDALRLLIERDPDHAEGRYTDLLALRQRQYTAARGDERKAIGEAWLDDQLAVAEAKVAAEDWAAALTLYRQALGVASRADPARRGDIQAALTFVQERQQLAAKVDQLRNNIKAAQAASNAAQVKAGADELLRLLVVEMDDPQEARKYTFLTDDAALKANVPLAAKDAEDLDEAQAEQLAKWYQDLASTASSRGKLVALERARGYYERYVAVHGAEDLKGKTVSTLTLKSINADLEKLAAANVVRAPSSAAKVDWEKDRTKVKYRWLEQNMSTGSFKYDDPDYTHLTDNVFRPQYHGKSVAWNLSQAKPCPVVFDFGRVVKPTQVRVYLQCKDAVGGTQAPTFVRVYTGTDAKPGRLIAELTPVPEKTGWHDLPLPKSSVAASRYYWIQLGAPKTEPGNHWILIEEVQFH